MNPKRSMPTHIIIKMLKAKDRLMGRWWSRKILSSPPMDIPRLEIHIKQLSEKDLKTSRTALMQLKIF